MCGKFTAMASWREVHEFSQPLAVPRDPARDEEVGYRVAGMLPVIMFDRAARKRRVVPMRWGYPHAKNPARPQPIHARSETVDTNRAFARSFHAGQRGIVVMKTFNEGVEIGTRTEQWIIDPKDGEPRGFAFVWERFDIAGMPAPMLACVMCTVPASALVRSIMPNEPDPRMPAILEAEDWATWLGENDASPEAVKAVLKTMEGVDWGKRPEPKKPKTPKPDRSTPPDSSPGLF